MVILYVGRHLKVKILFLLFFLLLFLSRPSSALISWSSTEVLVDHWGTFCAGGYPNVLFSFFLPGGCSDFMIHWASFKGENMIILYIGRHLKVKI